MKAPDGLEPKSTTTAQDAYLAGMLDARGLFEFRRYPLPREKWHYAMRITIFCPCEQTAKAIAEPFGGTIQNQPGAYRILVFNGIAIDGVIKKTLPYLIRTAPLARLLILGRELIKTATRVISEENHKQRADIIERLKEAKAQLDKRCEF